MAGFAASAMPVTMTAPTITPDQRPRPHSLGQLFWAFTWLALQGFGGVLAVLGYCAAFYLVSKVMNHMATGVVYAIWSGLGIVLISLVGWWLYGQKLDLPAVVGMLMIVGGVVVIQVLSKTAGN